MPHLKQACSIKFSTSPTITITLIRRLPTHPLPKWFMGYNDRDGAYERAGGK